MIRKIIKINEELCNGCGACASACHEGAIEMVNGKAKLTREHYCDGLGDCLPACPMNAIAFEEREAPAYDEAAVLASKQQKGESSSCRCPGSAPHTLATEGLSAPAGSQLRQWPVQIKLAPLSAPYYHGADLLIAADCTAYAYGSFHHDFIRGHITLIGCTKLDNADYSEKLSAILSENSIRSVTIARMEVPCCRGMEQAVQKALLKSGKSLPVRTVVISTQGKILPQEENILPSL